MRKNLIKRAALISIAIVFFAVAVTAFHHHDHVEDTDHCEICAFIMIFSAVIAPAAALFVIVILFCGIVAVSSPIAYSAEKSFNPSRAPPFISA
jgi:uncharacterized membrane protein (UPF0182 family)